MITDLLDPQCHFSPDVDGICEFFWRQAGVCVCDDDSEHYGKQCESEGKEVVVDEVMAIPV